MVLTLPAYLGHNWLHAQAGNKYMLGPEAFPSMMTEKRSYMALNRSRCGIAGRPEVHRESSMEVHRRGNQSWLCL